MLNRQVQIIALIVAVLILGSVSKAGLLDPGDPNYIEFVSIGDAGNAGEQSRLADYGDTTYYGGVNYEYQIGKYEVTDAQWNVFISDDVGAPSGNDVQGYNPYAEDGTYTGQQPTNFISWYEAVQFCNYLTTGDKSQGVYQFSGNNANPGDLLSILDHGTAGTIYGTAYFLPTENEWYKAAYYDPTLNSGAGGYWDYPTRSDTPPTAESPPGGDNSANYNGVIGNAIDVGSYTSSGSSYETLDQGGNVWEWNEDLFGDSAQFPENRVLRGGAWYNYSNGAEYLLASFRSGQYTESWKGDATFGFRVASIPEPATLGLLVMGGLALLRRKRGYGA